MNQKHHSDDYVRQLSRGGVYLGRVTADRAREMLRAGTATIAARTRKRVQAIYVDKGVSRAIPQPTALTYDEDLGDSRHVTTLKRYNAEQGTFDRWDPQLTFRELREGKYQSGARRVA